MNAYLILENGKVFKGKSFGYEKETSGELVFTTGAVGYIETLTDPAFKGQIIVQAFPLIGNYGMISADAESKKAQVAGYVVRDLCDMPSNFRMETTLEEYLKEQEVMGICDIDTRELTKIIREEGVMKAKILLEEPKNESFDFEIEDKVSDVSCEEIISLETNDAEKTAAILDLGMLKSMATTLASKGVKVDILPYNTKAEELLKYDGILLSSGPSDPKSNKEVIETVKEIMGKKPIFGIGLGHQILALANGGDTEKLKYGHRGANQPVRYLETGKCFITSQNHGYVVKDNTVKGGKTSFVNVNDNTVEGIEYENNAFSVQFYPAACESPMDTSYLYDKFIEMMEEF